MTVRVRIKDFPEFDMVEIDELTVDQVIALEVFLGQPAESWSRTMENKAMLWQSGVLALGVDEAPSWEYIGSLRPKDIERVKPEPEADADPPVAGGEPAPSPRAT